MERTFNTFFDITAASKRRRFLIPILEWFCRNFLWRYKIVYNLKGNLHSYQGTTLNRRI